MTDTAQTCAAWLALDAQADRLIRRWQRLETRLMARLDRDPEADVAPETRAMARLDRRIADRLAARAALLARLPALPVDDRAAALAMLAVAARLLLPADNPEAHALLTAALRALAALPCPACRAPPAPPP